MGKSIRLSKEFGVNPTMDHCFICGKETGIALCGTAFKDENGKTADASRCHNFSSGNLCDECKAALDKGAHFIIEVTDSSNNEVIFRTGRLVGVSEEFFTRNGLKVSAVQYMKRTDFEKVFGEALRNMNN